jgi:beta-lactamase superfamily II metal-dependent hydrolase
MAALLAWCLRRVIGPFVGLVAVALICTAPAATQARDPFLRVSFIDVGQGDAVWIKGPHNDDGTPGGNVIIDGGPDRGDRNRVVKYLQAKRYGLDSGSLIDCIIATHPHDDHYPGLLDVLAQYDVAQIVDSGYPKERTTPTGKPSLFEQFRQAALAERIAGRPSRFIELRQATDRQLTCGNVQLRVIHADSQDLKDMGSGNTRENNASTVVQLKFGAFTFLFMGDAEGKERGDAADDTKYVERLLLERAKGDPELLRADVLKVGHHGSETGSTLDFIRAVRPAVIVIMSGRKPFNGTFIPDRSVLERYRRGNSRLVVVRTDEGDGRERRDTTNDQDGDDVYMYTDGDSLRVFRAVGRTGAKQWRRVTTLQK